VKVYIVYLGFSNKVFNRYIRDHSLNIKIYMQASVKLASSNAKLYTRNRSMPKYTFIYWVFEERGMMRIYILYA
jgi:hypothetical protein